MASVERLKCAEPETKGGRLYIGVDVHGECIEGSRFEKLETVMAEPSGWKRVGKGYERKAGLGNVRYVGVFQRFHGGEGDPSHCHSLVDGWAWLSVPVEESGQARGRQLTSRR